MPQGECGDHRRQGAVRGKHRGGVKVDITILKNILSANDQIAERNRAMLEQKHVFAINVMSSPGAGKTSLILETIRMLKKKTRIGVIEGDISSSLNSERVTREQG